MSLLPSDPDPEAETEPRVLGVDSDEAGEALSALSSETTRELLAALHEEPATPSDLAERLDLTLQNVQYHLGKLDDADLVSVADTVYSEKGREMKVYGPADGPLVVFAGGETEAAGIRSVLSRLLGAVAALGVMSLVVQAWFGKPSLPFGLGGAGGEDTGAGDAVTANATATPTEESVDLAQATETPAGTATPEPTTIAETAASAETAAGLPPGALFFLGGLVVILGVGALWWYRR